MDWVSTPRTRDLQSAANRIPGGSDRPFIRTRLSVKLQIQSDTLS